MTIIVTPTDSAQASTQGVLVGTSLIYPSAVAARSAGAGVVTQNALGFSTVTVSPLPVGTGSGGT